MNNSWTNADLGIKLITNGKGYFPEFCPPIYDYITGSVIPDECKYGIMISDPDELKSLIEYVKKMRGKK